MSPKELCPQRGPRTSCGPTVITAPHCIEALFAPHAQHIVLPASPTFKIDFERKVTFTRPHRIEGLGQGTDSASQASGVGPTVIRFPFGCGKGFNFKDGGLTGPGAQRASLRTRAPT